MNKRIERLRSLVLSGAYKKHRLPYQKHSILSETTKKLPFSIRKSMAFEKAAETMPLFLLEGDLLVGGKTIECLPDYITEEEIAYGNPNFETKGYNNLFDNCYNLGQDARGFGMINSSIPAYYKMLRLGIPGLLSAAEEKLKNTVDPSARDFYRSVVIANLAALKLMKRYELFLQKLIESEQNALRKVELEQMSENLHILQEGPPATYWQALQLIYFIQFLIWTEGGYLVPLGRLDQILFPFFEEDKKNGSLDDAAATELTEAFFIKLNYEIEYTHGENKKINSDTGQTITLGGVDPQTGADVSNALTLLMLEAKCDTRLTDPKIHLRVHKATPEIVWEKAAFLSSLGMGFPTYDNDGAIIPAFLRYPQYTLEDARDYAAAGCWEMSVQGRSLNRNFGGPCSLRCLEWALNDGKYFLGTPSPETACGTINGRFGLQTGPAEWFDTFDKLFNAFKVQLKHHIDMMSSYVNRSMISPSPFYSSMMEDCLERGRDLSDGGARYLETDIQLSSLTNSADALCAIKILVYENREYSLRDFMTILQRNWDGHEALRQRILNKFPKFGNHQTEVDSLANDIAQYFAREVRKQYNTQGQPFRARLSGATSFVYGSQILGASADGRKARDFYGSNFSPMMGAEKNGPTAIILSCSEIDFSECAGGAVLDLKFHPSALSTQESRQKFIDLIKVYFTNGGLQTQINVIDNKVLIDAKKHPDDYSDLIVRIWGFSTYFTALPEKFQDHLIERSTLGL